MNEIVNEILVRRKQRLCFFMGKRGFFVVFIVIVVTQEGLASVDGLLRNMMRLRSLTLLFGSSVGFS